MRKISLNDAIEGVDGREHHWLLDDLDLPGTTGLVRFENINIASPSYGAVIVKACGLMHAYPTIEIAWDAPPGWSTNSKLTPVGYYAQDGCGIADTGRARIAQDSVDA